MFLDRAGYQNKNMISRACKWIVGMQSKNGGWGSFDKDNTYHLNQNVYTLDNLYVPT